MHVRPAALLASAYVLAADLAHAQGGAGDLNEQIKALLTGERKFVVWGALAALALLIALSLFSRRGGAEDAAPTARESDKVRRAEKPRFVAARANLKRTREVLEAKAAGPRIARLDEVVARLDELEAAMERATEIDPAIVAPMEYLVEAAENAVSKAEGGNLALVDEELARVEGWAGEIAGKVR